MNSMKRQMGASEMNKKISNLEAKIGIEHPWNIGRGYMKMLFVGFIIMLMVLISGCTTSTNPVEAQDHLVLGELDPSITNLGPNLYFVQCESYNACATEIKAFSGDHNITSIAALDDMSYGQTGGYFVVTR